MSSAIELRDAQPDEQPHIEACFGPKTAQHSRFDDGFTILAVENTRPIGIVAVREQPAEDLPPPAIEAYIDIIEVLAPWRRRGVGRQLAEAAAERARASGLVRIRAWSSEDKTAALAMWRALGFTLDPAVVISGRTGEPVAGAFASRAPP